MTRARLACPLIALAFLSMTRTDAGELSTTPGGLRLSLPAAWQEKDGGWVLEGGRDGGGASLVVSTRPGALSVHPSRLSEARGTLEVELRARGCARVEVLDAAVVTVDGQPAYRFHSALESEGVPYEQWLYVISAGDTHVLAVTRVGLVVDGGEPPLPATLGGIVHVKKQGGLLDDSPPSLCGALLGTLAGACCARRRREPRRG